MDDKLHSNIDSNFLVGMLTKITKDDILLGRFKADICDMMEMNCWLIEKIRELKQTTVTVENIEDFLIDLEIKYVDHAFYHLSSMKKDIADLLENI